MGLYFFFQAEDGIRDVAVTGVQTCALPISAVDPGAPGRAPGAPAAIYQNAPVGQAEVREIGVRVAIGGGRQLRLARAQVRKTTHPLPTASGRGRESAPQPGPRPLPSPAAPIPPPPRRS